MPPPDARICDGGGMPGRDHQVEPVAQPEGDSLEHGPGQVAPIVAEGQADERAPGERIGMRAALAGEVRQEEQPVAARRRPSPAAVDEVAELDARRERVAEPAQAAGGREHHRHEVPAAGHGVAERVDAAVRLVQTAGRSSRRRRRTCPSERAIVPGPTRPDPDRVGRLVAAAGHDRRPGPQAGRGGRRRLTDAGDLRTLERRRQPGRIDPERVDDLGRPVARGEVEQERARRRRPCRWRARRSAAAGRSPWAAGRGRSAAQTSGSWSRTQTSLGAVKPVSASLPVISISRSGPTACADQRRTRPRSAGRSTGSPAGAPGRPRRAGRRRASGRSARPRRRPPPRAPAVGQRGPDRRLRRRPTTAPGSCSLHSGWGVVERRTRPRRSPRTAPASSIRTAFVAVVETSMPRTRATVSAGAASRGRARRPRSAG